MSKIKIGSKIKKDDLVIIRKGKDRNKKGRVLRVIIDNDIVTKVVVSGINIKSKAIKPNPNTGSKGGHEKSEYPISVSNVSLECGRVGFKILENGNKVRYSKKTKEIIDNDDGVSK